MVPTVPVRRAGCQMLIAATGHRPDKLGGYGVHDARLEAIARGYLSLMQPAGVITGMALGWDTRFALAALSLGLQVHAAVPFEGQESRWPWQSQQTYRSILARCATVTVVCPGGFSKIAMQQRNEWMVDRAVRICAMWDGSAGGTGNCIRYAEKQKKPIDNLWQAFSR